MSHFSGCMELSSSVGFFRAPLDSMRLFVETLEQCGVHLYSKFTRECKRGDLPLVPPVFFPTSISH